MVKLKHLKAHERNAVPEHIIEEIDALMKRMANSLTTKSNIHGLQDTCSETLIDDECTRFAKKHGWKPKRGKKGSSV